MMQIVRLIRLPNLVIIGFTMFMIRYGIILSLLKFYGISLNYPLVDFSILVVAVMLVAAAGYMINDYHDVEIDLVNKSDKVSIGKTISPKSVLITYIIINAIALFLAVYTSIKAGKVSLSLIFPVTMGALWFYSSTYKSQLLIGTIIVSALTAMVPLLVLLYEKPMLYTNYHQYSEAYSVLIKLLTIWCSLFAAFAFLTTCIRELIKDAEDFEGDLLSGRRTMPIVYGMTLTKVVLSVLIVSVVVAIEYLFFRYLQTTCSGVFDTLSFFYIHLLIVLPLIVTLCLMYGAKTKKEYAIASALVKLVIVTGVLYALIVRYNLMKCI